MFWICYPINHKENLWIDSIILNLAILRLSKFSSVQFSSVAQSCPTLCNPMNCSTPTLRVHPNPCPSSQWCYPTISSSVVPFSSCPQYFPSIRVFSNESSLCIRWPKYWSFSFNISPCNEYPGLVSFRMGSLDLLSDQGTLKNVLQHHSSKASILLCSAFFIVPLSESHS